jgi:hypothetical protein
MTDQNFDATKILSATREAFAPVLKAQQEGFKALERLARLHYAVAGDVLETGLARVNATLAATSPTELLNKQSELTSQFVDKLRDFGTEIAAKAVPARKAA